MRIAILTSSRADYGIYHPLLKALHADSFFKLKIIVFGTHLSHFHGSTVLDIEADGFEVDERLETLILGDTEEAISNAIGNTITKFSSLWTRLKDEIDLVFALGDRYEMFAAVSASIPFNLKVVHIHGGETTTGAIDDKFRHAISLMSKIHFTSTEEYAQRVTKLTNSSDNIYNVGALGIDNLSNMNLLSIDEFKSKYNIDLSTPTILNTLHPETANTQDNRDNAILISKVFDQISKDFQVVITMPNADTYGTVIREHFSNLIENNSRIIGVESLGRLGYFSCMKHCSFLLGNTSSGLIEAPSLKKYVINVGERQGGRARSENVFDVDYNYDEIIRLIRKVAKLGNYRGTNIYKGSEPVAKKITNILKRFKT